VAATSDEQEIADAHKAIAEYVDPPDERYRQRQESTIPWPSWAARFRR
jgi:hypothetical protein